MVLLLFSDSESGSGVEVDPNLPYPGIAPYALKYLSQTTRPRSWCLALISNPYPFLCVKEVQVGQVQKVSFRAFRFKSELISYLPENTKVNFNPSCRVRLF